MKTIEIIDDDISIGDMLAEVLPQIQNVPVIVLSAKIDVESFAADYMTKPFEIKELLARITVQLRK